MQKSEALCATARREWVLEDLIVLFGKSGVVKDLQVRK